MMNLETKKVFPVEPICLLPARHTVAQQADLRAQPGNTHTGKQTNLHCAPAAPRKTRGIRATPLLTEKVGTEGSQPLCRGLLSLRGPTSLVRDLEPKCLGASPPHPPRAKAALSEPKGNGTHAPEERLC